MICRWCHTGLYDPPYDTEVERNCGAVHTDQRCETARKVLMCTCGHLFGEHSLLPDARCGSSCMYGSCGCVRAENKDLQ